MAKLQVQNGDSSPRLKVVANRLPVTIKADDDGTYNYAISSGGLATALSGVKKKYDFVWYGWPGNVFVNEHEKKQIERDLLKEHKAVPIWLEEDLAESHYNGFTTYEKVNRLFAQTVAAGIKNGDEVWIHDYHLMLLPQLLKEELKGTGKSVSVGFFLHTPFPSSEIYRLLPPHVVLLKGLLESDLIGFHTHDYARHFISSCKRLLKLPTTGNTVDYNGHLVTVAAFPVGIDPEKITEALNKDSVQKHIAELKECFQGRKAICGVDRLDYIKGVPQKLRAFERLLDGYPEHRGQVLFYQVAVPSRGDVTEYQKLRETVEGIVSNINGKYSTLTYTPIKFMHKSVDFDALVALYAASDVGFIASTRDGMNLVSMEYIAAQEKKYGQLVLSEFAGAAQNLHGAVLVNPGNTDGMTEALHIALTVPISERKEGFEKLFATVKRNTSAVWGEAFMCELKEVSTPSARRHSVGPIF